ncbi:sodium:calcium antiporter [Patescibacteria group bacterium]
MILYIFILVVSMGLLVLSGKWLIEAMERIGMCFKLKEFVLAFFVIGIGATIPNVVIGIVSALNGIPELSLGDVMGSNIFDLTIVIGLAALISRGGISANSKTVQGSAFFVMINALLPLILIFDHTLSRSDGVLLLLSFAIYNIWLFSKKDRFTKVYDDCPKNFFPLGIFKDFSIIFLGLILLFIGGYGIVTSATFFYEEFNLPLGLMGIFVVAIGTCLPETFFSLQAAKKGKDWMLLGNQMGNVAITSTLILGIVSLIQPIVIKDFSPFAVARIFLVIAAGMFVFSLRTNKKITKKEGYMLIGVYVIFLIVEIIVSR